MKLTESLTKTIQQNFTKAFKNTTKKEMKNPLLSFQKDHPKTLQLESTQ